MSADLGAAGRLLGDLLTTVQLIKPGTNKVASAAPLHSEASTVWW